MVHRTTDVFGVKSTLVKSYIERDSVDETFKAAIESGNEVIVYGSSKQGKTSLILTHLPKEKYVKVECSPQAGPVDLYKSVLRQCNITFIESETNEVGQEHGGKIGFKVKVPYVEGASLSGEAADKNTSKTSQTVKYVEYNLALAQDVSELLKVNNIYIVLENFHYLSAEVQVQLAYDLRVFQDHHVVFIILGIWREANRLAQFNGDLLDRITEVPVEPWDKSDFVRVINKGQDLLNVDFSKVMDNLIADSFDSIGVVQEVCKHCCLLAGVEKSASSKVMITEEHLQKALEIKANEYGARHTRNFETFVDTTKKVSSQSGKPSLAFPYYFIKLLLTRKFEGIEKGISRSTLIDEIKKIHHRPDDVRSGDVGAFLHNITQHQIRKNINPPFVDYDRGGKILKIIDSSLYLFLKHCDRNQILEDIPDPLEQ